MLFNSTLFHFRMAKYFHIILFIIGLTLLDISHHHGVKAETSNKDKNFYDVMMDLMEFVYKTQKNQDQFNFDKYQLDLNTTLIRCKAFMSDIILSGFSSFDYKFTQRGSSSDTNKYVFTVAVSYSQLRFVLTKYKLDLDILTMVPLYGEGIAGLLLSDVKTVTNVTLTNYKNGSFNVDLNMDFDIDGVETSLSGLLDTEAQSDLISTVLTHILPNVLKAIKPWLLLAVNPLLNFELNSYITESQITLTKLIALIESYIVHQ